MSDLFTDAFTAAESAAQALVNNTESVVVSVEKSPIGAVVSWQQMLGLGKVVLGALEASHPAVGAITGAIAGGATILGDLTNSTSVEKTATAISSLTNQTSALQGAIMGGIADITAVAKQL